METNRLTIHQWESKNLCGRLAIAAVSLMVCACATVVQSGGSIQIQTVTTSQYPDVHIRVLDPSASCPSGWTPRQPTDSYGATGTYLVCISEYEIKLTNYPPPVNIPWVFDVAESLPNWGFSESNGIDIRMVNWFEGPADPPGPRIKWQAKSPFYKDNGKYSYEINLKLYDGSYGAIYWDPVIYNN